MLQRELAKRIEKNPRYSLRAFARNLGISHGLLSMILSGSRPVSKKTFAKISSFLALSPTEEKRWAGRAGPLLKYRQIDVDAFALISDWYHLGILSLLELPDVTLDPKIIGRRLGITASQATVAIQRLKRLDLIAKVDGRWKQVGDPIECENTISTPATRKFHHQLLQKAREALEEIPISLRDFSSMTFAMSPELLPYAAAKINEFRKSLTEDLESRAKPGAVYQLTIQLFPLTEVAKEKTP